MKILRAVHLGMCFGVRDAIALALEQTQSRPVTILGDLVHNETVLNQLRSQGVKIEHQVANVTTPDVLITAHGASQRALHQLEVRGLRVIEATCPLVHHAHRVVQNFVTNGYHPVIVGKSDHVEVRGITEDLDEFDVILDDHDVAALRERPRFGVAAQTTQPINRVRRLVTLIQERFPNSKVRFADTVCQPTKQRQSAAVEVAQQCDIVIVIGGANSNNTRELVATCSAHCDRVYHVQGAADLRSHWFRSSDRVVGITAGTSTPDCLIDEVEAWLQDFVAFQQQLEQHVTNGGT
ncbi:MAG TPA: 4-hydroxy-3-methylbut-2-enyl diphosphate reductase [Candidatus Binatia bacterium]|nr:4-hydroxy-3-methylbut-2-enyl diphosphate reductase [Candidatus Binatia bacterium]